MLMYVGQKRDNVAAQTIPRDTVMIRDQTLSFILWVVIRIVATKLINFHKPCNDCLSMKINSKNRNLPIFRYVNLSTLRQVALLNDVFVLIMDGDNHSIFNVLSPISLCTAHKRKWSSLLSFYTHVVGSSILLTWLSSPLLTVLHFNVNVWYVIICHQACIEYW